MRFFKSSNRSFRPVASQKGFTLIEMLVVGAILAILAGAVSVEYFDLFNQSRRGEARIMLENIQFAMELYKREHGHLPPKENPPVNPAKGQDICSLCSYTSGTTDSRWTLVADELAAEGYFENASDFYLDPWDNYFAYDNNYLHPAWKQNATDPGASTAICSVGRDRRFNSMADLGFSNLTDWFRSAIEPATTGDDVCVYITDND